jgi:two-component sensor histidine kinase
MHLDARDHDARVLLLLPTPRDATLTAELLHTHGRVSVTCRDVTDLCRRMGEGAGVVLLAEDRLDPPGLALLGQALADQPPWSDVPIVLLRPPQTRTPPLPLFQQALILDRPVAMPTLVTAVATALRARQRQYDVRAYLAERARTEADLREALTAKDAALATNQALLREVHHRVKNNLQMLCDLLYLQMEGLADAAKADVLRDTYSRLYAIARLHEQLYQSIHAGAIELPRYLEHLLDGFRSVYPADLALIAPTTGLALDLDRAVHVGLIVNELVTNALKHAFPRGARGEVVVHLRATADQIELAVRDTGVGLPPGLGLEQAKTLGLRIVHILARRLNATVRVENHGGAAFTLTFPLHADAPVEPR